MQIVSNGDSLHEMPKPVFLIGDNLHEMTKHVFWRNKKNVLKFVRWKFYPECWALISRKREIRAVLQDRHNYMGLAMRKRVFGHMLKAKAHISLCICAVSSAAIMSANRITGYYRKYELKQMPGWDIAHAREDSKSAFCACSKTAFCLARPI